MRAKVAVETWVGRALLRLEDEALLRGEGRFIDDLDPFRTRGTPRCSARRSHMRTSTRLDASAAFELPGVIGVLTGEDVVAL